MVDLRKWFPALAVAAIALSMASTANAQTGVNNPPLTCTVQANPSTVRQEGFTELVGDVVITCSGGQPTLAGALVPRVNVTVSANTNITSRLYGTTLQEGPNEALLAIDEPAPEQQRACLVGSLGSGGCGATFFGVYNGWGNPGQNGLNYLTGTNPGNPTLPNVWQGRYTTASANNTSVLWTNIPVDPPGTNALRTIRLTNIRADATQFSVGLVPSPIQLTIQINPPTGIPVAGLGALTVTVAFVSRGLTVNPGASTSFRQCDPPTSNNVFSVGFQEGFPSAFRNRFIATTGISNPQGPATPSQYQRFFNSFYFTESGFFRFDMPLVPSGTGGQFDGSNAIGYATHGTRLAVRVPSLPAGVAFVVPNQITNGQLVARLVTSTDSAGAGGTFTSTSGTTTVTSGLVVYEIVAHDPFSFETLSVPMTVTYTAFPSLGSSSVQAGFAPFYAPAVGRNPSSTAPVPRFIDNVVSGVAFQINACRTHILFPFVSNQIGFDTGIAISNTSLDTGVFNTTPQSGPCRLHFYGQTTGGGAPPAFITSQTVNAGAQLLYVLSSGGNLGLTGVPGFQGYMIAVCDFQYGHAFAYITDNFGGTPRTAEGYIALILDEEMDPITRRNRNWSISEVLGH